MLEISAIALDMFAKPVQLRRMAEGEYVNGIWQQGAATETNIMACVHAVTPETVRNLPEGIRTEAAVVIYTRTELFADREGQSANADQIVWGGDQHRILQVWPRVEGAHYKAVAGRVGHG